MNKLFNPKTIALVGASNKKGKIGNTIMKNLLRYKGAKIYPINLKSDKVMGLKAYNSISQIPERTIDLVVIAVPSKYVPKVLKESSNANYAVIISAGFKEIGNTKAEEEIIKIAKDNNTRIIGPNVVGILNNNKNLDSLFLPKKLLERPKAGEVSIISQSGTVGALILDKAREENIGVSKFVSYGNSADIDETDILEYLDKDKSTKTILCYFEEIKDGDKFFKVAKKIKKKIIIMKAGLSKKGSESVQSHTGSLAGSREVYKGILKQLNIPQAKSITQMINFAKISRFDKVKNVGIVTNGGGYGIIISDRFEENNIKVANIPKVAQKKLKEINTMMGVKNPIDVIGDANAERFYKSIKIIKPYVDFVVVMFLGQTPTLSKDELETLLYKLKKEKRIVFVSSYKPFTNIIKQNKIVFERPEELSNALGLLR